MLTLNLRTIDLQVIEDKADNDEYKNVEEFRADILTFVHNIIIFHGGKLFKQFLGNEKYILCLEIIYIFLHADIVDILIV